MVSKYDLSLTDHKNVLMKEQNDGNQDQHETQDCPRLNTLSKSKRYFSTRDQLLCVTWLHQEC